MGTWFSSMQGLSGCPSRKDGGEKCEGPPVPEQWEKRLAVHMFDAQILLRVLPKHAKTIKAHLAPGIRRPAHAELIKGGKSREASSANMGQKVPGTSNDRFLRSQEGS